jgi:hypothetical protein
MIALSENGCDVYPNHPHTLRCPKSSTADEMYLVFDGTAVNLLSSVRINGKEELLPFGTSLGYLFDVKAKGNSLETLSLKCQLATGDYAEVQFPRMLNS